MARIRSAVLALLVAAVPMSNAPAQTPSLAPFRRIPRAWLVISDGIGPTSSGSSYSDGLDQLWRLTGVVAITASRGIEVSALRIREVVPVGPSNRSANGTSDGVVASFASLTRSSRGGIPSLLSIGVGAFRRPGFLSTDPDRTSVGFQAGFENDVYQPPMSWIDLSVGGRILYMPAKAGNQLFMVALTIGLRVD